MLWFGWFGFNAGSALAANGTAAMAFATTNTASAAAMLGWMFFDWMRGQQAVGARRLHRRGRRPGGDHARRRATSRVGESIVIGLVASVVSNLAVHWKTQSTLDDTLDVFPCHGVGGMVGMLADRRVRQGRRPDRRARRRRSSCTCCALVIVAAFSFVGSYLLYKVTDLIIPLRVTDEQEERRPRPQPARRSDAGHRSGRSCLRSLANAASPGFNDFVPA